ncbi:MAG: multiprotein-bridging factor 1 family protein [Reyranella sp.]
MISAGQLRAARALIGMDQKTLAEAADVSVQTIQRMEASDNLVRGVVESLVKVIAALERLGIELINDSAPSTVGGRGVRLKAADATIYKARDSSAKGRPKESPLGALGKRSPRNV